MHYKNGRPVAIGDWVVGISHNSDHKTVCGYVVEIMLDRGPCNIRLLRWREEHYTEYSVPQTTPIERAHPIDDYGDAKEFIRVDDGLRMVTAVAGSGNWDGPYFQTRPSEV